MLEMQGFPLVKRAVVLTPSSLTKNWRIEIRKWLGDERLQALVLQPGPEAVQQVCPFRLHKGIRCASLRDANCRTTLVCIP